MKKKINFYPKLFLCLTLSNISLLAMHGARTAAIPIIAAAGILQSGSESPVPPLLLDRAPKKECGRCKVTENIQRDGCDHYFCKECREEQGNKGCPICSKRAPHCAICQQTLRQDKYKRRLHCGHVFCGSCISKWENQAPFFDKYASVRQKVCPICKTDLRYVVVCNHCSKKIGINEPYSLTTCSPEQVHTAHKACLNEFIEKDIKVEEDDETYYRINDKGQFYYRCVPCDKEHPLTQEQVKQLGITTEPTKLKKYIKPPKPQPKSAFVTLQELFTGQEITTQEQVELEKPQQKSAFASVQELITGKKVRALTLTRAQKIDLDIH